MAIKPAPTRRRWESDRVKRLLDEAVMYRNFIQGAGPRVLAWVIRNERMLLMRIKWDLPRSGTVHSWMQVNTDRARSGISATTGRQRINTGTVPTLASLESREA